MAAGATQAAFVGRVDELDRLHAALLERAERPAVFIGGEAGIGKTRLIREFGAHARAAGATVVVGGCQEVGADTLPFTPFVEAVGRLHEVLDDRADAVFGPGRAELAVLVPALGEAPAGGDGRVRLYEAIRVALDGADDPTIVILEDLHWADHSSLELLSYLVRRLRRGRTLIIGTFRTDEIPTEHPLSPVLAALTVAERCVRIELAPLDRPDTAHLVADLRPDASGSEVDTIAIRSEGNPFFARELALAPRGASDLLPDMLRYLLLLRIARLSPLARSVVDVMAAIGRPASPSLLRAAWEGAPGDLDAGLADALDAQVIVAAESGAPIAFRHDLLADAVLVGLRPIERIRLHERLATVLTSRPELAVRTEAGAAAEIARHWVAAERDPLALVASVRAAVAAERIPAWAETLAHYEAAIDAWDRVPETVVVDGLDRAEVLHRAAYAANLLRSRDNRRAVDLETRAVDALDDEADPIRAAEFWASLSQWCFSGPRDYAGAARAAERATGLVPPHPPSQARAAALASLARVRCIERRYCEAVGHAQEALEVAGAVADLPIEARARAVLGVCLSDLSRDEEAVASARRAVEVASWCHDAMATNAAFGSLLYVLGHVAATPGDLERAFTAFREAANRLDILEDAERWWIPPNTVHLHYMTGAWDAVEAGATEMLVGAEPHMTPVAREWQLWMRGSTRVERGRLDEGEDDLHGALGELGEASPESVAEGNGRLATAALIRKRPADALALIEKAAAAIDRTDYVYARCQVDALGLRVAADLADLGRSRRDSAMVARAEAFGAARLAHVRAALAGTLVPGMGTGRVVRTLGAWGLAEASRLDGRSDPAAWEEAASLLCAWIEPALVPYARCRQAEALLAFGHRAAAGPCLRAAHARALELGAAPLLADIAGLARRGRINLVEATAPVSPAATAPVDPYGLSAREREVLALLVDGRTNREIGAALFISERTASVHVTHILDKLGVNSRGAAAAVAVRAGLVPVEGA